MIEAIIGFISLYWVYILWGFIIGKFFNDVSTIAENTSKSPNLTKDNPYSQSHIRELMRRHKYEKNLSIEDVKDLRSFSQLYPAEFDQIASQVGIKVEK